MWCFYNQNMTKKSWNKIQQQIGLGVCAFLNVFLLVGIYLLLVVLSQKQIWRKKKEAENNQS